MHTHANSWKIYSVNHKSANCSQKTDICKKILKYPVGETRILDSIILRKAQGMSVSCCCRFNSLAFLHSSIVKL